MWQWRAPIKRKYYCFHVNSYWSQNCYSYTIINLEFLHFPAKLLENLEVQHQYHLYLALRPLQFHQPQNHLLHLRLKGLTFNCLWFLKLMSTFSSHMVSTVLTYSLVTVGETVFSSGALPPFITSPFLLGLLLPSFCHPPLPILVGFTELLRPFMVLLLLKIHCYYVKSV